MQAQQAAAYSARELVQGEVLLELVAVHRAAFSSAQQHGEALRRTPEPPLDGAAAAAGLLLPGLDEDAQFLLSYELGTSVLRDAGLCLPSALDGAAATGHLMAAALRHRQLSQPPAGERKSQHAGHALVQLLHHCIVHD